MSSRLRATHVLLDQTALRGNLLLLKRWAGPTFFCPMVKAFAYGHGDVLVAKAAESVDASAVGVALIEEGVGLRQAGIRLPILVFAPFDHAGAEVLRAHDLTPVVGRFEDLEALASFRERQTAHLKFNTGMQRLGFDAEDLPRLRARLQELPSLKITGTCTHLTHGEEVLNEGGPSRLQIRRFQQLSEGFSGVKHLHKSATLALLGEKPLLKEFGARPGIAVYGLPYEGHDTGPGLKPVLSWHTQLARIHAVEKGHGIGYGARFQAERRSFIGVVPVGYADGYMRRLGGKSEMLWRGRRVPVVGSVCMDYTLLDLTDALHDGPAQAGEPVVILGRQGSLEISAAELAEQAGTIAYEVVTAISRRVPREAL